MKSLYSIVIMFLVMFSPVNSVFAQKGNAEKAKVLIENYDYSKAIDTYSEYFKKNTASVEELRDMVFCYLKLNDTKNATEWCAKLISHPSSDSKDILKYAYLLKCEGRYKEAIEQYRNYLRNNNQTDASDQFVKSCLDAEKWIENPEKFNVTNQAEYNSEFADFGLIPFEKGFIFVSDRKLSKSVSDKKIYGWTGNEYLKLFLVNPSQTKDEKLSSIKELDNKYHNGPGIFNASKNRFYFTRTKMVKVKQRNKNIDPTSWMENIEQSEYLNRLEIYSVDYSNGKWQNIKPFEYNNVEQYSVGHPALSPDGKTLYFVSDMPGGFGETDIYYSTMTSDGKWSQPKNAGKAINTVGKEMFPSVDSEGTLCFSSDGHSGMGGLDLFKSTGNGASWSEPVNMKYPFNSPKDDFLIYYTQLGQSGYFSSNRDGGKGNDDIYKFEIIPPKDLILVVRTKELDKTTNKLKPLKNSNISIKQSDSIIKTHADAELTQVNSVVKRETPYALAAVKEGYYSSSKEITTIGDKNVDTMFVELVLEPIIIDKPIVLKNIYYDFDKSDIRSDAIPDLEMLVKLMKENPDIIVELGSHTDSRGSDEYNIALSQRRANAAVKYIISKGISNKRITAKGYGETNLLNNCSNGVDCDDVSHQLNRRTEFKVTGFISGKKQTIESKK